MNGATIALAIAGLVGVFAGVYLTTTGNRLPGIAVLSMGLIFQVLCLRQLKLARTKDNSDAG